MLCQHINTDVVIKFSNADIAYIDLHHKHNIKWITVLMICFSNLDQTMGYILMCLRRDRDRSAAFQATGLLAVSVGSDISQYLPRIMEIIRSALPSKDQPTKFVLCVFCIFLIICGRSLIKLAKKKQIKNSFSHV